MYAPQSMKVVGDRGLFRTSFGRKTASPCFGRWNRRVGPSWRQRRACHDLNAPYENLRILSRAALDGAVLFCYLNCTK